VSAKEEWYVGRSGETRLPVDATHEYEWISQPNVDFEVPNAPQKVVGVDKPNQGP